MYIEYYVVSYLWMFGGSMVMLYIFFAHYVVWSLPSPGLTTILVLRLMAETAWKQGKVRLNQTVLIAVNVHDTETGLYCG